MRLIEQSWYHPRHPLSAWLMPLAWLFAAVSALRRGLFAHGLLTVTQLPVPVVVIGNLTVGGTGKTPLTAALACALSAAGRRPGIVSRGYGGQATRPQPVPIDGDPTLLGDEPLLLAQRTGVPVFVHRQRALAAQALLAAHPEVDIILCDDGLQHYALGRDIELCVVDAARGLGNGCLLPAGPLREPVHRLTRVDAIIINGEGFTLQHPTLFRMTLQPGHFYRLGQPTQTRTATDFASEALTALCGIGNPQRFFDTLTTLGLRFVPHDFPDHHVFSINDLPSGTLLVTEKDAVKIAALPDLGEASARIWILPVTAALQPDLAAWLLKKLNDGRQIARNPGLPNL